MLHLIKFQSGHSCVIHAKWGNLGFKKPGSAVHTLEHQLQQKITVQILFQLIEWIRVSSLIYRSTSTCKFYFKKKSLPAKCLYKIQCLTWYERWLLEIEATSLRRPFWVRVPICATDRHVVYQLHLDLVWLRILTRSVYYSQIRSYKVKNWKSNQIYVMITYWIARRYQLLKRRDSSGANLINLAALIVLGVSPSHWEAVYR